MKKILSLLGSLTLITTSTISVISCGYKKEIIVDPIPDVRLNIEEVELPVFIYGANYQDKIKQVIENFETELGSNIKLKLNEDYIIADQTDQLINPGFIWIISLNTSKKIYGQVKIIPAPIFISDIQNEGLRMTIDDAYNVDQFVIDYIKTKFLKSNPNWQISPDDYEIYDQMQNLIDDKWKENPLAGDYLLQARETSTLIKGKFTFTVYKDTIKYDDFLALRLSLQELIDKAKGYQAAHPDLVIDLPSLNEAVEKANKSYDEFWYNPNTSQHMVAKLETELIQVIQAFTANNPWVNEVI